MTQECLSRLPVVWTCTALEIWRIIFSCHKTRQDWSHLFNRGGEMKHPAGYGIDLPNTELSHPKCQQLYHWQTWVQRLILVPFAAVAPACDLLAYSHPPIPVAFHSQVSVVTCHIYLAPVPCPTWCVLYQSDSNKITAALLSVPSVCVCVGRMWARRSWEMVRSDTCDHWGHGD